MNFRKVGWVLGASFGVAVAWSGASRADEGVATSFGGVFLSDSQATCQASGGVWVAAPASQLGYCEAQGSGGDGWTWDRAAAATHARGTADRAMIAAQVLLKQAAAARQNASQMKLVRERAKRLMAVANTFSKGFSDDIAKAPTRLTGTQLEALAEKQSARHAMILLYLVLESIASTTAC